MIKKNFKTKAESIFFLKRISKNKIYIPDFFFFKKKDFIKQKKNIIKKIKKKFKYNKVIVRSSALDEDSKIKSNAGKYLSVIVKNPINYEKLIKAINKVVDKLKNFDDQIIVQTFIEKPEISGVIFTKDPKTGSDYYVINYDKSKKTDLITSGKKNLKIKTEVVYKKKIQYSQNFKKILKIIKYLEQKYNNDSLDIEFAIKKNKLIIFQCRSLLINQNTINIDDPLVNIFKKIKKIQSNLSLTGKYTILSNMSDWNPAEMIGSRPMPLSISLYSELITNKIWSEQRSNYGYKDVRPNPLMFNLLGFPYIDLRTDINSFLPKNLPDKIEKKIVNFYLSKIRQKPHLHDKIEFDVIETFYDILSTKRVKKFLNPKEAFIYLSKLKNMTANLLKNSDKILIHEQKLLKIFEYKIRQIKKNNISEVQKIHFLINIIKQYGTLPFSGIARFAFISTKILRSLESIGLINQNEIINFYESIHLITRDIIKLATEATRDKKKLKLFKENYGHLRPSTYSIVSKNYSENFSYYFGQSFYKKKINKKFKFSKIQISKINLFLKLNGMKINFSQFTRLAKKSIQLREKSKLIFTKGINEIFVNLISLGKETNIKRDDLQYLNISEFKLFYNNLSNIKLAKILKEKIKESKKEFKYLKYINLPDVICSPNNVYAYEKINCRGNYITAKVVSGDIVRYSNNLKKEEITNKIILIENADPGYDFLFNFKIIGLITKYGGANSHMSIRCLEENIPACVGIGEKDYDLIKESRRIELDCYQNNFTILL